MAGIQDFWTFQDDFIGLGGTFATSADSLQPWIVSDTSAAGTPTYVRGVDHGTGSGAPGVAKLDFDTQTEAQVVALCFGGIEQFDIQDKLIYECRLKMNQAAIDSNTTFSFGLCAGRNATWESTTVFAAFQLLGSTSTTVVYVETDDNVTDTAPVTTGQTLVAAYKYFKIDLTDLYDVKFYMTGGNSRLERVAASTTFEMAGYTGCLEPVFQLQKASDNNADGVTIDYVKVSGRRNT